MRLSLLRVFFTLSFFIILIRLFYWQVLRAEELVVQAEKQHFAKFLVKAKRGNIFFSDNFPYVSSMPAFSFYAQPKILNQEEKNKILSAIPAIILKNEYILASEKDSYQLKEDHQKKLTSSLFWISLEKKISLQTKKEIEDLKIKGLGFDPTFIRFYPESSSSAHILGFVGSDAKGEDVGYFGLEGYYEKELRGSSGFIRHEKDALGLPILIGNFFQKGAKDGKDLVLNLDRSVQFIVENTLKKNLEIYGAKSASAVVMDPKTGGILAMASYPNYDPAAFWQFPKEYYKNPLVADQYEPGSTFKVLVMAAAINEGLVSAETICDICSGPISLGGFKIRTWNNKYYPNSSMQDVIRHSDNTGMVFVGKKLGVDKFLNYLENYGFGTTTNIDLQDESSPKLRSKKNFGEIDLATASFGQGIAVTPIQMVRAIAAVANGGLLMEPHIVREIKSENNTFKINPRVIKRVLSQTTTKIITEMMVKAVDEGEARAFKPKGFRIAGKTGTAQIPVEGHYDPDKTIASFVGFAPADEPKFVMLIIFDQPTSSVYGSETAAPTFFEIAEQLFPYFKISIGNP